MDFGSEIEQEGRGKPHALASVPYLLLILASYGRAKEDFKPDL